MKSLLWATWVISSPSKKIYFGGRKPDVPQTAKAALNTAFSHPQEQEREKRRAPMETRLVDEGKPEEGRQGGDTGSSSPRCGDCHPALQTPWSPLRPLPAWPTMATYHRGAPVGHHGGGGGSGAHLRGHVVEAGVSGTGAGQLSVHAGMGHHPERGGVRAGHS